MAGHARQRTLIARTRFQHRAFRLHGRKVKRFPNRIANTETNSHVGLLLRQLHAVFRLTIRPSTKVVPFTNTPLQVWVSYHPPTPFLSMSPDRDVQAILSVYS